MQTTTLVTLENQIFCKRCGSGNFFTEAAKPPHHLALRCKDCGLFAKFLPKKHAVPAERLQPYPQVIEAIRTDFQPPSPAGNLAARLEILERKFASYDVELKILVRAILSAGVLQPKPGAPGVAIDDERIGEFGRGAGGR